MTPHPQRCRELSGEGCYLDQMEGQDDEYKITFAEIEFLRSAMFTHREECAKIIRQILSRGCASHSSQQVERDKVLDAVMDVVNQYIPFGDSPTAIMVKEIKEAKEKAELRSSKGGE